MGKTLIIVDVQYDFLEGGALAVGGADLSFVRRVEQIRALYEQVILTADSHPPDHVSFSTFPPHCVAGTHGAEIALACGDVLLLKGESADTEEFSAFIGGRNVDKISQEEIHVLGLAGDYCVRQTLLDLIEYLPDKRLCAIVDLIRSVDGTSYGPVDYFGGRVRFLNSYDL